MGKELRSLRPRVDLDELAHRESEQVKWKENVADVDDVVATLSAFANDLMNLGGGYVVCGAREARDEHGFPKLVRTGLTAARLKEIEARPGEARRGSDHGAGGMHTPSPVWQ